MISDFAVYWNTSIQYGMQWFWDVCTYSNPDWVWSASDHIIFDDVVQIPCTGQWTSLETYDMNAVQLGVYTYVFMEFAQNAYVAKYGQSSFESFDIFLNLNSPQNIYELGFGSEGTLKNGVNPSSLTWINGVQTFPNFPTSLSSTNLPFLNTHLHEIGHNMNLMHAGSSTWSYGDCSCIMGCANTQMTCYSAPNARLLGYIMPIADLSDVNMPPNLWVSYTLPIFSTSNVNHLTIRSMTGADQDQTIFLSARSSTANSNGADSGLSSSTLDHQLLIEATLRGSLHDYYNQYWLIEGLTPGQMYDLMTVSQITQVHNHVNYANFAMQVAIQLVSMSDAAGATVMVCRYVTAPSDCSTTEGFSEGFSGLSPWEPSMRYLNFQNELFNYYFSR
jgi:hypothetical protein